MQTVATATSAKCGRSTGAESGNSPDKLRHTRSVAYSVEPVVLNKPQISGGGAYLNCYPEFWMGERTSGQDHYSIGTARKISV